MINKKITYQDFYWKRQEMKMCLWNIFFLEMSWLEVTVINFTCFIYHDWFGLVSLFNGISTLFRLFNAKAILLEEHYWYYLTHSWEDKGVHTFPKGICPKVNVIARLEYELAYYDSAVHRFNRYTTSWSKKKKNQDNSMICFFTTPTVPEVGNHFTLNWNLKANPYL